MESTPKLENLDYTQVVYIYVYILDEVLLIIGILLGLSEMWGYFQPVKITLLTENDLRFQLIDSITTL